MNILEGKTLKSIKIAEDKKALLFQTDEGDYKVLCDGDCCSDTWIEQIEMPALGFPCLVIKVEDLAMPDLGEMKGCDVVAYYGCKISTDKGDIVIDYRNESNGYYGGDLSWPNEYHYGGVAGQNKSNEDWRDVVDAG